mmetsp:Transcript_2951/g.4342  ORF Transcript_2951/g.4342 Transcript_2951/m.4342 type:complete len:326 (+) Transcript_2951:38-1015(+)
MVAFSLFIILALARFMAATSCTDITSNDALFIVDTQNDFMEAFPIPKGMKPNYDISGHILNDKIVSGSLAVGNTSEIINPINKWISYFKEMGGKIFASLDWHDANHCSFCRNGTKASNPGGFHPKGGLCGPLPQTNFDASGRCMDSVAVADYNRGALMQWPDHCLGQKFGSRFQPYLNIPEDAIVVKKGWDQMKDTYSAFGGTESVENYPFDTRDAKKQLEGRPSLEALLEKHNITRFWAMGIALDFCVGGTVLDALGKNPETHRAKPSTVETVVLVLPCTRAVDSMKGGPEMIEKIEKAGGVLVRRHSDPVQGIQEACSVRPAT